MVKLLPVVVVGAALVAWRVAMRVLDWSWLTDDADVLEFPMRSHSPDPVFSCDAPPDAIIEEMTRLAEQDCERWGQR